MELDRRVVDVDDAVDPPGDGLADVVDLGLAHTLRVEEGRAGLIERDDDAALEDRLRRVRCVGGRTRLGYAERWRRRRQCRRLCRSGAGRDDECQRNRPEKSCHARKVSRSRPARLSSISPPKALMADPLREQLEISLGASYVLERELGGGGMARVFLARDLRLERQVVVKVLSGELAESLS